MDFPNNTKLSASCIVFRDDKVLLVRHTYGAAKDKYLIPGGFSEIAELPDKTAEREVYEETNIKVKAKDIVALRFTQKEVWCIFYGEYESGEPQSDLKENNSVVFMDIKTAINSDEVMETTRILIKSILLKTKSYFTKSEYVNKRFAQEDWKLYI